MALGYLEFAFLFFFFSDLLEGNQLSYELYQTERICMNKFLFQQYQNQVIGFSTKQKLCILIYNIFCLTSHKS